MCLFGGQYAFQISITTLHQANAKQEKKNRKFSLRNDDRLYTYDHGAHIIIAKWQAAKQREKLIKNSRWEHKFFSAYKLHLSQMQPSKAPARQMYTNIF